MLKKISPLLLLPLLLAGCTATFTNLTPSQRPRSTNNLYQVEVALASRQQTLRWDSIQPKVLIGTEAYPMRRTPLLTNRWEGLIPVPTNVDLIHYRYKFDYEVNAFGRPQPDSAMSSEYTLKVLDTP